MLARSARVLALVAPLLACAPYRRDAPVATPAPSATAPPAAASAPAGDAAYACFDLRSPAAASSLCFATAERCERERADAARDGAEVSGCGPVAPVSCFQLGGDPNPSMEVCAVEPEHCELWRLVDHDKNGTTGAPCAWRHASTAGSPP